MITKILWEEFKQIKLVKNYSIWSCENTPDEKALDFIIRLFITPFSILFDLILMPGEILYYIVKKHYERKLERRK